MRYTSRQKFPYPASEKEYGNGGVHMEALAVAADAALDRVSATWTALRKPSGAIYKLTSNVGVSSGSLTDFSPSGGGYTTIVANGAATSGFPWSVGTPTTAQLGWWDMTVHVATQPTGTVNSGTRRYLQVQKTNQGNRVSGDTNVYIAEDVEAGTGVTAHELNFLIYVDTITFGMSLAYFHANTSSTVNILASGTYLQATQLTGAIS